MGDIEGFDCVDFFILNEEDRAPVFASFSHFVWQWYATHKRDFIWRETSDPYHILLSELMLQQTQTERVIPKYTLFLNTWPTLNALCHASLTDVLYAWKGLGYNKRAKALHSIASLSEQYHYTLPPDESVLLSFPMIGPATASAIRSFAFGQKSIYLETNIRRVIIHHFFSTSEKVHDKEIREILMSLMEIQDDAKNWYYALMDYGVNLKKIGINPNRRSSHYKKQSPFENSHRQIRSTLLFIITTEGIQKESDLIEKSSFEEERILYALQSLQQDGFIHDVVKEGEVYYRILETTSY